MSVERRHRYLDLITAAFVATLLISNVASTKVVEVGPLTFDGGTLLFPLAYLFGDVLTEVYGYRRARRVIWTGFALLALAALTFAVVDALPPAPGTERQAEGFRAILGFVPRLALASLVAYGVGAFANSYVLARLKVRTRGRWLWLRTLSSTAVGQGLDTLVFLPIAFYGVLPNDVLLATLVSNYVFKVLVEVAATPVTYAVVGSLKRAEGKDAYDRGTNFNPFALVD